MLLKKSSDLILMTPAVYEVYDSSFEEEGRGDFLWTVTVHHCEQKEFICWKGE